MTAQKHIDKIRRLLTRWNDKGIDQSKLVSDLEAEVAALKALASTSYDPGKITECPVCGSNELKEYGGHYDCHRCLRSTPKNILNCDRACVTTGRCTGACELKFNGYGSLPGL